MTTEPVRKKRRAPLREVVGAALHYKGEPKGTDRLGRLVFVFKRLDDARGFCAAYWPDTTGPQISLRYHGTWEVRASRGAS